MPLGVTTANSTDGLLLFPGITLILTDHSCPEMWVKRDLRSEQLEISLPELRRWTQVGSYLVPLSHQVCSCRVFPRRWHFQLYRSPFSNILSSSSGKVLFCAALLCRNTIKGGESRGIQQSFPVCFPDAVPRVCASAVCIEHENLGLWAWRW